MWKMYESEQFFDLSANLRDGKADDYLHGFAFDHCTMGADGFEICIILQFGFIVDIDTQAHSW